MDIECIQNTKILLSNTLLIFKNIEKEKKRQHVVKKEKRDLPEMFVIAYWLYLEYKSPLNYLAWHAT